MARYAALAAAALLAFIIWWPLESGGKRLPSSRADSPPPRANLDPLPDPLAASAPIFPSAVSADKGARSQVVPYQSPVNPDFMSTNELLGAEKLAIKFQGEPELSGTYRIGPDGGISIPVIGRLSAAEMDAAELEAALAERVSRYTGRKSYVTVEVASYRPVFVAGFVQRPNSYDWRPGMTVLQGVALAGGLFRQVSDGSSPLLNDDGELSRLRKAVAKQKRNLAALARLEAERQGAAEIVPPQSLLDLVGNEEAKEVIQAEASSLTSKRASLEAKKVALARATEMANKQLQGLSQQAGRLEAQLATRRNYKSEIDNLKAKGIVSAVRSMDESARVGDLEDRSTTVAVAIARIEGVLASLERDRVNLEHDWRAQVDQDIIKVARDISDIAIEIESARDSYRKLTGSDPTTGLVAEPKRKSMVAYKIVRHTSKGPKTIEADQLTVVGPGDIIVVALE